MVLESSFFNIYALPSGLAATDMGVAPTCMVTIVALVAVFTAETVPSAELFI